MADIESASLQFAVMGSPVAHSKSPRIHTLFAHQFKHRIEYTAIERWEAASLQGQFSAAYEEYIRTVPKWIPRWSRIGEALRSRGPHPWREVFFSERGTLLAAALMSALMVWRHLGD